MMWPHWFTRFVPRARRCLALVAALVAAVASPMALPGCTPAKVAPTFDVGAGGYARAFDESVETLREFRFTIDRVDAAAGVITSAPKTSSGLATPWDKEQSTLTQEVEDLLAFNSRRVRITFEPRSISGRISTPHSQPTDFHAGPLVGRVEAVVDRRSVRGWRVSSAAILQSDFTYDTQAAARGQPHEFDAPLTRDERLAARIADRIRQRLAAPAAATE